MPVVLSDIVESISKATKLTRPESRVVADRILDSIAEGLSRGEDFEIRNFGTFKTRIVSGKVGRHLSTGTTVILPPMRRVSFRAGKFLKPVEAPEAALLPPPPVLKDLRTPEPPKTRKAPVPKVKKVEREPDNGEQTILPGV